MKPLTLPQELRRHAAHFWFVVSPSTKSLLERAAARIEELERPIANPLEMSGQARKQLSPSGAAALLREMNRARNAFGEWEK